MARKATEAAQPAQAGRIMVPETLAGALLVAQNAIDSVGKDARNSFHKYAYTSAEGMIGACRGALHVAGLAFQRTGWALSSDGMTVTSRFVLHHPQSGQSAEYEAPWIVCVEKGRPVDKALAGALTTCMGYFLRDLLLLPREEGDVMDRRRDDPDGPAPSVGFRQSPQPAKRDAIADLNRTLEKPKSPAPQAAPVERQVEATVRRSFLKHVGDKSFTLLEATTDDGELLTLVCDEALAKTAQALVGSSGRCRIAMRGDKTPVLKAFEPLQRDAPAKEDAADEPDLPY